MIAARLPAMSLGLLACVVVGALAAGPSGPALAVALVGLLGAAAIGLVQARTRIPFVGVLVLLLFGGYIVLNRNFAELHIPAGSLPVYVGELMLVVALPWALSFRSEWRRLQREPVFVALLCWQAYSAGRLLGGGLAYGIDALRDSAIWYYGLYAIVGFVLWPLVPRRIWTFFFSAIFLGLIAVSMVFALAGPLRVPIPGSDPQFPTSVDRADVMSVSLVAGATFFLLVLRDSGWFFARVLLASVCLGLLLPLEVRAASLGFVLLLGLLAAQRKWQTLAVLTAVPAVGLCAILALGSLQVAGRLGSSSASGLIDRQLSTLPLLFEGKAASSDPNVDTAAWRVAWWTALLNQTTERVDTTLLGVGFGTDLTGPVETQFGVQLDDRGRPVRSPHNILVTLFARTGIFGLAVWLAFQWAWFHRIFQALGRGREVGLHARTDDLVWLSGYVILILVSATLGVVLEGPYGAIPYFLLVGMSLRCASDLLEVAGPRPVRAVAYRSAYVLAPAGGVSSAQGSAPTRP